MIIVDDVRIRLKLPKLKLSGLQRGASEVPIWWLSEGVRQDFPHSRQGKQIVIFSENAKYLC